MKKYIIALMALVSSSVYAGDGFFIGAGAACQIVPAIDGTRYSAAPAIELGYNGSYFGISASGSVNGEAMVSLDINSRFPLAENADLLFGGGMGAAYRKMQFVEDGINYKTSGFINWPHANVGVEFTVADNFGIRLIGALGYARCNYVDDYPAYDYYYYDHYYNHYEAGDWRFAAQIRAMVVWTF